MGNFLDGIAIEDNSIADLNNTPKTQYPRYYQRNSLSKSKMTEFQRKIELQSPDDLQYLISNIRRAANEKIDKDLPPIEGEDKMRERVEELVHEVCLVLNPPHPVSCRQYLLYLPKATQLTQNPVHQQRLPHLLREHNHQRHVPLFGSPRLGA